jgi:glycosyltransferase involved in cell wall biosynthesis
MTNSRPLISIITCTYNSEKYLQDCLSSIKNQTFTNFEHIIIDGKSTDNSLKIAHKYKKNAKYSVKIVSDRAKGISSAMNLGINHAQGLFINHLHSDDMLADINSLKKINSIIQSHPQAQAIVGNCQIINQKNKLKEPIFPREKLSWMLFKQFTYSYLLISNKIPHPSTFIKKSTLLKYGSFDEKLHGAMDYNLWLRLFAKIRPTLIKDIISIYRFHEETYSEKNLLSIEGEVRKMRNKYRILHPLKAHVADLIHKYLSYNNITI